MILGLPPGSWVLIVLSVGIGLAVELAFWTRRRRERGRPDTPPRATP